MPSAISPQLTGTLPVLPFSDRFYGQLMADRQKAQVAALATARDGAVLLSAAGYETTLTALFATFFASQPILFEPADDLNWPGPTSLARIGGVNYRRYHNPLSGTNMRHYACLPLTANLQDGFLHPVEIPEEPGAREADPDEEEVDAPVPAPAAVSQPGAAPKPRFILGNANEEAPHASSFLGVLRVLRVITLVQHAQGGSPPEQTPARPRPAPGSAQRDGRRQGSGSPTSPWVHTLWRLGCESGLIVPIPALGVRAWQVSGDLLQQWRPLVSQGVLSGELRWEVPTVGGPGRAAPDPDSRG